MAVKPLRGKTILLTRPAAQMHKLREGLQHLGAEVCELPLFTIEPAGAADAHAAVLRSHRDDAGWIFTSTNAVRFAAALDSGPWPKLFAIGPATALALRDAGHSGADTSEAGSNSEALLALTELQQSAGKSFLIVTGQGGRSTLADGLRNREALVEKLELYRRAPVAYHADTVSCRVAGADGIICTSGEGVEQLVSLTPDAARAGLFRSSLVVPSPRVLELARSLGFANVSAPAHTSDENLIDCLVRAFDEQQGQLPASKNMTDDAAAPKDPVLPPPAIERAPPELSARREPVQKATSKTGAFVAVAMGVIILALLAVVAYAGWLLMQERANVQAQIQSQNERVLALSNRVDLSTSASGDIKSTLNSLALKADSSAKDVEALQDKVEDGLSQISRVSAEISGGRARFELASVEHLLSLANDRLLLAGDVRGALIALEGADERLTRLADPQMFAVRAKLAGELSALRAVKVADVGAASLALASLIQKVPQLTLAAKSPSEFKTPEARDQASIDLDAGWPRFVQSVKVAAQSLFTVRRDDDAEVLRLLSPEAETAVFDILTLKLEGARVSMLKGDTEAMRAQLSSAQAWLQKQFRTEDGAVAAMIAELEKLSTLELSPELPDISGSFATLRRKLKDAE